MRHIPIFFLNRLFRFILTLLIVPLIQGCGGGVGFGKQETSLNQDQGGPKTLILSTQKTVSFNNNTDILFVLDDSCSMNTIIEDVRSGVESVSALTFAPNTEMAVTYMSPVENNGDGSYNFVDPYYPNSLNAPGFLKFVSKTSVDFFMSTLTAADRSAQLSQNFTQPVCNEEWFAPGSQPAGFSSSCLAGAMQIPSYCTGVEAGGLVVDQLAKKLTMDGKKVFRDDSNAHIVFVSDTHDAGANFYGTASNRPDRMPNVDELKAALLNNNPKLQSLRFSGIVPLPLVGDPKLNGLNVIGPVPQTPAEQSINGEADWDFSYLDLVKETGGVAMHAQSDDWSAAMQELIEFTETPSSVLVVLQQSVEEVLQVTINGQLIAKSQFTLLPDKNTVEVFFPYAVGVTYQIEVQSAY